MAPENKDDEEESKKLVYAALGVGIVCIVIGIPLWWKTTDVYRVTLPYDEIYNLAQKKMVVACPLSVVIMDPDLSGQDITDFAGRLRTSMEYETQNSDFHLDYKGQVRHIYEDEKLVYKKSKTVKEFNSELKRLKRLDDAGDYLVFLLPKDSGLDVKEPFVASQRSSFFRTDEPLLDIAPKIAELVKNVYVKEEVLLKGFKTAKGRVLLKPDKEGMRAVRYHPGYEVTFTLINPQPDIIRSEWDISNAVKSYLDPFLDNLRPYADFSVKSQVLYYTGFIFRPRKSKEGDFYLRPDDLPHLINPIESELGSHVSSNPSLDFVLYVPTRSASPLHIHNYNGQPSPTNSFLSPQWGGVIIHNVPNPANDSKLPVTVDIPMKHMMEIYTAQLRMLLGIQSPGGVGFPVKYEQPGQSNLQYWELDFWMRKRTIENLASATATLKSLARLLDTIKNMVINDEIGQEVHTAVECINRGHHYLSTGKLREAFHMAKQAILSSEKAFFDPSLLELLYFPEDQKFAIYIPLFLPISLPVFTSLFHAFKYYKSRSAEKLKKQ